MPYESGSGDGNGFGGGWGSGFCGGWGSGFGSGWGNGCGSGSGDGRGDGRGLEEERKKIELNILENIPSEELLLYMHCWEFQETQYLNLLKEPLNECL
jgi:hypothetical protein